MRWRLDREVAGRSCSSAYRSIRRRHAPPPSASSRPSPTTRWPSVGIHHGPAIAVTLNDELDYFGQTVNITARVQALADAHEICITEEVRDYPGVEALLAECRTEPVTAEFQGVGRSMPVIKIGGRLAAQSERTG